MHARSFEVRLFNVPHPIDGGHAVKGERLQDLEESSGIGEVGFVGGALQGLAEGGVVALEGGLEGGVVLLGVEEAGGGIGVDELDVVFTDGGHAKQAPAGEVLQLEDVSLGVEVYGLLHEDGVLETI